MYRLLPFLIGFTLLLIDQLSKRWAMMLPIGGISVFQNFYGVDFSLELATNTGVAWSLFNHYPSLIFSIRVMLILAMLFYLFRLPKRSQLLFPLCLIISGAIGNIIDYLLYGYVIDLFHFVFWSYDYPIFNVADSAICVGVALYLILSNSAPKSHDSYPSIS